MSNDIKKIFLYGLLLIAGVTFGMQLAESGNKNTYGVQPYTVPQSQVQQGDTSQYYVQQPQMQTQSTPPTAPIITTPAPADILLPSATKPSVDKFADKTANLLQKLSKQSINWVASLFGTVD